MLVSALVLNFLHRATSAALKEHLNREASEIKKEKNSSCKALPYLLLLISIIDILQVIGKMDLDFYLQSYYVRNWPING